MDESWELITGIVVAVIVLLIVTFYGGKYAISRGRGRNPPGPWPWPVVGNLPLLAGETNPQILFMKLSEKYGPLMSLRMGSVPAIVISSPELAKMVLKTYDVVFASRLEGLKLTLSNTQLMGSMPFGQNWRHLKKLYMTELLNLKRLDSFQGMRREQIESFLLKILDESRAGKQVPMRIKFSRFTSNNITRMMANGNYFGDKADLSRESYEFQNTITECFVLLGELDLGDFIPILKPFDFGGGRKAVKESLGKIHKFFDDILEEHRQQFDENNLRDLIDVLLMLSSQGDECGRLLTQSEMRDALLNMILAGTDTSAGTLEWALADLLRHPEVMKKAQEEIDTLVGRERLVEESDIPKLKYLVAIVKEVFRLHPAAPLLLPHRSMEDCEIHGYFIPAGTLTFVNVYAIGRNPRIWERPLDFWPERFKTGSIEPHGMDFELLPFGSGRRICPGKNLALILVQHTLAAMIQCFDWKLPGEMRPQDLDMSEKFGTLLNRAVPLEAIPTPRVPVSVFESLQHPRTA